MYPFARCVPSCTQNYLFVLHPFKFLLIYSPPYKNKKRFGILWCCSKAKRYHGIGDESQKDGAAVFLTGGRFEFDTPDAPEGEEAVD